MPAPFGYALTKGIDHSYDESRGVDEVAVVDFQRRDLDLVDGYCRGDEGNERKLTGNSDEVSTLTLRPAVIVRSVTFGTL